MEVLKTYEVIGCISSIVQKFGNGDEKCLISIDFHYDLNIPTQVYSGLPNNHHLVDISPNIYLTNLSKNNNFFEWIENIDSFNPRALFIVIDGNRSYLTREFKRRFISKTVFLNSSNIYNCENNNLDTDLKSAYEKAKTPEVLPVCVVERKPYVLCVPPNCTTFEDKGLSIDLIDFITGQKNVTPFYKCFEESYKVNLAPIQTLLYESCELVQRLIDKGENILDVIPPINDDYDKWNVPRSEKIPQWKYPFMVFPYHVWLSIMITTLISALSWYALNLWSTRNATVKKKQSFSKKLLALLRIYLEQPSNLYIQFNAEFVLLIGLFSMISIFTTMYKSRISALLLGAPLYEPPLKNFEEVLNRDMYLHFGDIRTTFLGSTYPKLKNYNQKFEPWGMNWMDMVAFRRDTAALMSYFETMYQFSNYKDEDGRNLVEPLSPPFIKCLSGFNFLRGNPFVEKIGKYINLLRMHGFIQKIVKKYEEKLDENEKVFSDPQRLNFGTLSTTFMVWIIGICIAIIAFIFEFNKKFF